MSFMINAWMEQGEPQLGIVKTQTGIVVHQWRLSRIDGLPRFRTVSRAKPAGIQQLVRELFLIGCAEEIARLQGGRSGELSDRCLYCDKCLKEIGANKVVHLDLRRGST